MEQEQANPFIHDQELMKRLEAAGHKAVSTLGQWRALDGLAWDALGESLVVRFHAGPPDRPAIRVNWEIPHALAKDLLVQLAQAVAERDCAAPTRQ